MTARRQVIQLGTANRATRRQMGTAHTLATGRKKATKNLVKGVYGLNVPVVENAIARWGNVDHVEPVNIEPVLVSAVRRRANTDNATKKHHAIVNRLLTAGASPNVGEYTTPLIAAVKKGNVALVDRLLRAKAKVNGIYRYKQPPLLFLLSDWTHIRNPEAILDLLLKAGASVRVKDSNGMTPVMLAAMIHPDLVRRFVSLGADINAKDNEGRTALMMAIEHVGPGEDPVEAAAGTYMVDRLVGMGANVNLKVDKRGFTCGQTALMLAVKRRAPLGIIDRLLRAGADVTARDAFDEPVFHVAVESGVDQIVARFLQEPRVDVNGGDPRKCTPLMLALLRPDHGEMMRIIHRLIRARADVNARNVDGLTPLMFLVVGNPKISSSKLRALVGRLLRAGADLTLRDSDGKTALMHAQKNNIRRAEIALILQEKPSILKRVPWSVAFA